MFQPKVVEKIQTHKFYVQ